MEREEGTGRINRRLARELISRPATVKGWSETEEACKAPMAPVLGPQQDKRGVLSICASSPIDTGRHLISVPESSDSEPSLSRH